MKKITLLSTVFILLALFSCRKDDMFTETDPPNFPGPDVNLVSSYSGFVVDQAGLAIQDALVIDENGNTTQTDENGFFKVAQGNFSQGGSLFKVQKQGYIQSFRFVSLQAGEQGFTKVVLVGQKQVGSFDSADGDVLTIHSVGATLKIEANSVVQENGTEYTGQVEVFAHWYDPQSLATASTMPGDLRGVDFENNEVILETYGMVSVELIGANGEELNLKENTTATLEFPIVGLQESIAPEQIPLWSLNEETGYWIEEGKAIKEDNVYKAEVSHFSFWNCDYPWPLVEISGTVKDEDGNPIVNALVSVTLVNTSITGTGFTDGTGYFEGKVPKNEILLLSILNNCGTTAYSAELGPLQEDTMLGDIEGVQIGANQISFSGSVVECTTNTPITNGYVMVFDETGAIYTIVNLQEDGSYAGSILSCEFPTLGFQAVNSDGLTESEIHEWDSSTSSSYIVPDLEVCNPLDEYLVSTINGVITNFPNSLVCQSIDDILSLTWSDAAGYTTRYNIDVSDVDNPELTSVLINLNAPDMPSMTTPLAVDNFTLTIDEYPAQVGEFIQGDLSGEFTFDGVLYDVVATFRMELIKDDFSLTIYTWNDNNENGIYEEDTEILIPNVNYQVTINDTDILDGNIFNIEKLFFIPKGSEVDIEAILNGNVLTLSNVDPSQIDNDFEQDGTIENILMDQPQVFYCGVLSPPFMCSTSPSLLCEFACTVFEMIGGQQPYTIEVNGTIFAPSPANTFTFCDPPGIYEYTVTDVNGETCTGSFVNAAADGPVINNQGVIYACENEEILADLIAEVTGGTLPYSFNWSNGFNGEILENVVPGNYTLFVTDANGCETSTEFVVEGSYLQVKGKVWDDNQGSIPNEQEAEDGIAEVTIELLDETNAVIASTTSLTNGLYVLEVPAVLAGNYVIEITVPNGFELVDMDSASSDEVDSDADPTNGKTDIFEVGACNFYDFDFGLK